jgi:hypothetical protein
LQFSIVDCRFSIVRCSHPAVFRRDRLPIFDCALFASRRFLAGSIADFRLCVVRISPFSGGIDFRLPISHPEHVQNVAGPIRQRSGAAVGRTGVYPPCVLAEIVSGAHRNFRLCVVRIPPFSGGIDCRFRIRRIAEWQLITRIWKSAVSSLS